VHWIMCCDRNQWWERKNSNNLWPDCTLASSQSQSSWTTRLPSHPVIWLFSCYTRIYL